MSDDLRTGEAWNASGKFRFTVLDPDGWDRTNGSWSTELISEQEFRSRAMMSTCMWSAR